MGREEAKRISAEKEELEWPYFVSIDLRKTPKPKVAFLSGMDREYYPENPGHSLLAVKDAKQHDAPNPSYVPGVFGINKPISNFGYGIGGLLSARFAPNKNEDLPGPGQYQKIFQKEPGTPLEPKDIEEQCKRGFGRSNAVSRFGRRPTTQPPGPGTYDLANAWMTCTSVAREEGFGGKRKLLPGVITVCMVDGGERCCECKEEQFSDYYRSRKKLRHPEKKRASILAICRKCYCKAWNGGFPYWDQAELSGMFQKARHCDFLHEHQRLHQFMHKTSCEDVKRLTRREIILNKYYKDSCPPTWSKAGQMVKI